MLSKNQVRKMEKNQEEGNKKKGLQQEKHHIQRMKERKLNLFGHICRMEDNRLVKELM